MEQRRPIPLLQLLAHWYCRQDHINSGFALKQTLPAQMGRSLSLRINKFANPVFGKNNLALNLYILLRRPVPFIRGHLQYAQTPEVGIVNNIPLVRYHSWLWPITHATSLRKLLSTQVSSAIWAVLLAGITMEIWLAIMAAPYISIYPVTVFGCQMDFLLLSSRIKLFSPGCNLPIRWLEKAGIFWWWITHWNRHWSNVDDYGV